MVVNDLLLTYYEMGTGSHTILFLHGWGSNSTLWFKSVAPILGPAHRFVFLDLPGFGKSESPKHALSLNDFVEYVSTFCHKREIAPVTVVGHSFGGKVAIRLTTAHSQYIKGLVLVDSSGLPHTSTLTRAKIAAAKTLKPIFSLPFMHDARHTVLRLMGSDDYVADPKLRETFVRIIQEHITEDLTRVASPTLIIWGAQDDNEYTPVTDATVLHQAIKGSTVTIIPGASHYSFMDNSVEFQKALGAFIAQLYGKN